MKREGRMMEVDFLGVMESISHNQGTRQGEMSDRAKKAVVDLHNETEKQQDKQQLLLNEIDDEICRVTK